jgi:hypothetical protein
LKVGGKFIATFPCSDRIARRLRNLKLTDQSKQEADGEEDLREPVEGHTQGDETVGNFSFGNKLYRVTFTGEEVEKLIPELADSIRHGSAEEFEHALDSVDFDDVVSRVSSTWGEQYKFWLTETIADQEEYIVPTMGLEKVLADSGLAVEMSGNFAEIFEHYTDSSTVKDFLKFNKTTLSDDEDEIFRFYRALVVKKI